MNCPYCQEEMVDRLQTYGYHTGWQYVCIDNSKSHKIYIGLDGDLPSFNLYFNYEMFYHIAYYRSDLQLYEINYKAQPIHEILQKFTLEDWLNHFRNMDIIS